MFIVAQEWEQAIASGRAVLRNTYIVTYFMERSERRQRLELLQTRLELQLGQLTETLRGLPHRRTVVGGEASLHVGGAAQAEPLDAMVSPTSVIAGALQSLGRVLVCACLNLLRLQGMSLGEMTVQGQQVRQRHTAESQGRWELWGIKSLDCVFTLRNAFP